MQSAFANGPGEDYLSPAPLWSSARGSSSWRMAFRIGPNGLRLEDCVPCSYAWPGVSLKVAAAGMPRVDIPPRWSSS